jgi:hypothetical protein
MQSNSVDHVETMPQPCTQNPENASASRAVEFIHKLLSKLEEYSLREGGPRPPRHHIFGVCVGGGSILNPREDSSSFPFCLIVRRSASRVATLLNAKSGKRISESSCGVLFTNCYQNLKKSSLREGGAQDHPDITFLGCV